MGYLDSGGLTYFFSKIRKLLDKKANLFTVGDGLQNFNDTVSVTTPIKDITQAEYDTLTEEEKSAGLYIVTDANINLNDRGDVYSTEETRIGTWVDGKPVYRKTTVAEELGANGQILAKEVSEVINCYGVAISGSTIWMVPETGNDHVGLRINNGVVTVSSKNYGAYKITLTLEYTKTTDTAPTSQATLLTSKVDLPSSVTLSSQSTGLDVPVTVTFPSVATVASASASTVSYAHAFASASSAKLNL